MLLAPRGATQKIKPTAALDAARTGVVARDCCEGCSRRGPAAQAFALLLLALRARRLLARVLATSAACFCASSLPAVDVCFQVHRRR